jgi:hypothetical protein
MGNFKRDWSGQIIERDYILRRNMFKDMDGNVVNDKGYLIDASTGDIRSKYTFEVVFKRHELLGRNKSELPLPYRTENSNFNPHDCLGNFDYDSKDRPIILKDKHGDRVDKHLRRVNGFGWLIDADSNVIDNLGQVKFIRE